MPPLSKDFFDIQANIEFTLKLWNAYVYRIRLSYIFEIPSISNEKPSILIKIPRISIENLEF